MKTTAPGYRVPQVNLFGQPRRQRSRTRSLGVLEMALVVFVVAVWAVAGVVVALLLGWHPPLAPGT
ncbi:MAG TPA: hypothetical protein VKF59_13325 [Candidatus Dormibacteraeota bacterium]|nr:hypothetical protein [Candidatus Dormibacteraeota bacterium]